MTGAISASIEVNPAQILEKVDIAGLFPAKTRVYITDIGTDPHERIAAAVKMVADKGYIPVPHFPARRFADMDALKTRLSMLTAEVDLEDVLVIAGEADKSGIFDSSFELIETGMLQDHGVKKIGIAGHPEGSKDIPDDVIARELDKKADYAAKNNLEMRIVTQFGFDGEGFVKWANALEQAGNPLPIHLGVSGPAKITTLIKYAAMCGVGASLSFLKKKASVLTVLATKYDPDEVVNVIEAAWRENADGPISQVHVFPFGGLNSSSEWLHTRGSFVSEKSDSIAS